MAWAFLGIIQNTAGGDAGDGQVEKSSPLVLYVGAAPGRHLPALVRRLPHCRFEFFDPADFDIKATSKDKEQADQNILIQLQKVISLRGQKPVEFGDGKKQKVHPNVASAALSMHRKLRRTDEKDAFQRKIGKSYRDLLNAVKGK